MRTLKYIIPTFIFIVFTFSYVSSQSNTFVEWKFLQLTNIQNDGELSADNYRNAELVADSIIYYQDINFPNAHFFIELARSYEINNEHSLAALSILRQQCLYPNDSLNMNAINLFVDACLKMQIQKDKAVKIFKNTSQTRNYKSYSDRLYLLIESGIQLFNKKSDVILLQYLDYYKGLGRQPEFRTIQWAYLSKIKLSEKKKGKTWELNYNKLQKNIWQVDDPKLQKRIIMRAEHYYAKENAKGEAKYLLSEYKKLDLNIFNKFQCLWRKMILPIR